MSVKQKEFIKKYKRRKTLIFITQVFIALSFLLIWEISARNNIINTFITSSPTKVITTIISLAAENNLFKHIYVTVTETIIAFSITTILSLLIAILFYSNKFIAKVFDPYLTMLNSLPKVALGPILIIWIGANKVSIVTMAILISLIISIQNIYNGFIHTDKNKIKLLETFNASKWCILKSVVIPSNYKTITNTLKINISMSLIGVIMGEFLTSKQGLGYLILYGSQVFNLNLVISGIFLLIIISVLMYQAIVWIEKKLVVRD